MNGSKAFFSRNPEIVSDRILAAAEAVFRDEGFAAASTNRIVDIFGGSKGTMFRHFPTKDDLLVGVIGRISKRLVTEAAWDDIKARTMRTWLIEYGRRGISLLLSDDALFVARMVVAQGRNFPMLRETFEAIVTTPMHEALSTRLTTWADKGAIEVIDAESDATLYIDLLAGGWLARSLFGIPEVRHPQFYEQQATHATDLYLSGRIPR